MLRMLTAVSIMVWLVGVMISFAVRGFVHLLLTFAILLVARDRKKVIDKQLIEENIV